MVNCENNINLIFTREALEELINHYNDNYANKVVEEICDTIKETSHKEEIIEKDFATKEQRETFNEIMSKVTCLKKSDKYPDCVFYMVGDSVYMEHDLKTHIFYIRYNNFWRVFRTEFNLNHQEIGELLRCLLEEHLNCEVNTIDTDTLLGAAVLEEHLKCEVNTSTFVECDEFGIV